jgi:hypothetical protein
MKVEPSLQGAYLRTSATSEAVVSLRNCIEPKKHNLDDEGNHLLQELENATAKVIAERDLLLDENKILFDQNNEVRVQYLLNRPR